MSPVQFRLLPPLVLLGFLVVYALNMPWGVVCGAGMVVGLLECYGFFRGFLRGFLRDLFHGSIHGGTLGGVFCLLVALGGKGVFEL